MFMTKNNFISWLVSNDIIPSHNTFILPIIMTKTKTDIFKRIFDRKRINQKCQVLYCNKTFDKAQTENWDVCFQYDYFEDKEIKPDQMTVVCKDCHTIIIQNSYMWDELIDKQIKNYIIGKFFDDSEESKCYIRNCVNIATIDSFTYRKSPLGNHVPICSNH